MVCIIVNVLLVSLAQIVKKLSTIVTQIPAKMEELVLPSMIHTRALVHQVIAERTVKLILMNVTQTPAKMEQHVPNQPRTTL
tara:strand:+ start:236 stop:481 length:246 start_codon:yes stop_codon:yes gene_type:complete